MLQFLGRSLNSNDRSRRGCHNHFRKNDPCIEIALSVAVHNKRQRMCVNKMKDSMPSRHVSKKFKKIVRKQQIRISRHNRGKG